MSFLIKFNLSTLLKINIPLDIIVYMNDIILKII